MSDFVEQVQNDVEQRREQLLEKHRELTGEEIIKVRNLDTGEADYTPIWLAHPFIIESAVSDECDQVSLIDEVQYMSEAI
ncbi:hypothetical protein [Halolamina sp. C58]|uniref:hypothetical protein n=1 Tax=Halolamina sp. C58 TaxID=3421640 RepID=UPI003EBC764B